MEQNKKAEGAAAQQYWEKAKAFIEDCLNERRPSVKAIIEGLQYLAAQQEQPERPRMSMLQLRTLLNAYDKEEISISKFLQEINSLPDGEALVQANEMLRSCYQVAKRMGQNTNWDALTARLKEVLQNQHELKLPNQFLSTPSAPERERWIDHEGQEVVLPHDIPTPEKEQQQGEWKEAVKHILLNCYELGVNAMAKMSSANIGELDKEAEKIDAIVQSQLSEARAEIDALHREGEEVKKAIKAVFNDEMYCDLTWQTKQVVDNTLNLLNKNKGDVLNSK